MRAGGRACGRAGARARMCGHACAYVRLKLRLPGFSIKTYRCAHLWECAWRRKRSPPKNTRPIPSPQAPQQKLMSTNGLTFSDFIADKTWIFWSWSKSGFFFLNIFTATGSAEGPSRSRATTTHPKESYVGVQPPLAPAKRQCFVHQVPCLLLVDLVWVSLVIVIDEAI